MIYWAIEFKIGKAMTQEVKAFNVLPTQVKSDLAKLTTDSWNTLHEQDWRLVLCSIFWIFLHVQWPRHSWHYMLFEALLPYLMFLVPHIFFKYIIVKMFDNS